MNIEAKDLHFSYSTTEILKGVSFQAGEGELIALLGPNGAGKSTLFGCLLGFLKPNSGCVLLDGTDMAGLGRKQIATQIAYIPQNQSPSFNHTVLDSVLMGAANRIGTFEAPGKQEMQKAMEVLKSLGIQDLAARGCMQISGGERQLMLLARAIFQDAHILVMDEPTANLDFGNSYKVMKRILELKQKGYTIIMSTHDPNQVMSFASRVIALKDGKVIADGDTSVLTADVMESLYNVRVSICDDCRSVNILQ
ncbi:MAG: ABC transporter ATP-binding protein [Sphaerochaetaceae bacterium]|nr:ABC transporter ATP-binding protein [Sphaerochaetaceae bacterium]